MTQQRWARVTAGAIAETMLADLTPGAAWVACPDECSPTWRVLPDGALVPPAVAGSLRIITSMDFRDLFTEAERIAIRAADPRLADGELKAMTQGTVNILSLECAQLMVLAVAKLAITQPRADRVLAGLPPL